MGSGGGGAGCPIKYDNIGRRITASGNSAIKVPGTEDDEDGGSLAAPPSAWQDNVNGNSGNKGQCALDAEGSAESGGGGVGDLRTIVTSGGSAGEKKRPNGSGPVNNGVIALRRLSLDNVPL